MSFLSRIEKSEIAVNAFDNYLRSKDIDFSKTGYEDLSSSPSFMEKIRKCNDGTSNRLRYFPDRTIINKKCMLIEIKHGTSIEKDAFDNYMDLEKIGYNIGIVFYKDGHLLFCEISDLQFEPARQWKKISNNGLEMPIVDGVWYCPRHMNDDDYFKYKNLYLTGSATSFAFINFEKTNFITLC